jgi:hypothetical protein
VCLPALLLHGCCWACEREGEREDEGEEEDRERFAEVCCIALLLQPLSIHYQAHHKFAPSFFLCCKIEEEEEDEEEGRDRLSCFEALGGRGSLFLQPW